MESNQETLWKLKSNLASINQLYWVGGLSRLTLCKVDSKWCALWEKHDKVLFLAILSLYMFMFDVVCTMFSSCPVQTCGSV